MSALLETARHQIADGDNRRAIQTLWSVYGKTGLGGRDADALADAVISLRDQTHGGLRRECEKLLWRVQPPAVNPAPAVASAIEVAVIPGTVRGTKVCPLCAEQVQLKAVVCRFCGYEFDASRTGVRRQAQSSPATSGVAIAAFVTSLFGLWPIAIPLGVSGQREIDRSDGRLAGRGYATAGIVLGAIGVLGTIVLVIALVHAAHHHCAYVYQGSGACVPGT